MLILHIIASVIFLNLQIIYLNLLILSREDAEVTKEFYFKFYIKILSIIY